METSDVRALLQTLGELRELGTEPAAWRQHLARSLNTLCGADVCVISELRVIMRAGDTPDHCAAAVRADQMLDAGLSVGQRASFCRDVYWTDHKTDDALNGLLPLYGSMFTVTRRDLIGDRRWDRSRSANERYRAHGCDDFVMSMAPVPALGVISSMEMYRGPGTRFGPRERELIAVLHEELARDWSRDELLSGVPLTPRQRQVLARLVEGASEKELACELGVSAHTAHDHVKALHKAFGARSRGELLARVRKATPARTRLLAHG